MKMQFNSFAELKEYIANDAQMQERMSSNPQEALQEITITPLPDTRVYRILVVGLIAVVLSITIGVIVIVVTKTATGDNIPTILTAIGSAAIGALAGILAPSPIQQENPQ
jgi:hypothetical protein